MTNFKKSHYKIAMALLFSLLMPTVAACGNNSIQSEESSFAGARSSELQEESGIAESVEMSEESSEISMPEQEEPYVESTASSNVLIVYFSRMGNTEYPDDVDASTSASIVIEGNTFGTTEYMAHMIQESTGGDLHLIQTQEPYPVDFDELREQNRSEMGEGYFPVLAESNLDIAQYDTVFIGYPIWAMNVPQAVLSFLSEYDLSGKTVVPFCTHDGYGEGSSYNTIRESSHAAQVLDGLAIEASDVPTSQNTVMEWLTAIGITGQNSISAENDGAAVMVTINDIVLDGVLYDTDLAQEIAGHFPMTVTMYGYYNREYYGGLDFTPETLSDGQHTFENGHITYCRDNNTIAIFYAQTDRSVLHSTIIPIGKVTSDLSVFDTFDGQIDITFSMAE